jgi:flagellar motor switch protein FliM
MVVFSMKPLEGNGILEIKTPLAFELIDLLFGGKGGLPFKIRPLTEIERVIIGRIGQQMLNISGEVWANVLDFQPRVASIESNPQFAQIVSPTEMVILVSLEARIGQVDGIISYCLPYLALEPILGKLSAHYWFTRDAGGSNQERHCYLQEQLSCVKVPVKVLLGSSYITVKELLEIQVGDVVTTDQRIDQDLGVYVGNRLKFTAKPGVFHNRIAVQITGVNQKGGSDGE